MLNSKQVHICVPILYLFVILVWNFDSVNHINRVLHGKLKSQIKRITLNTKKENLLTQLYTENVLIESYNDGPFRDIGVNAYWVSYLPFLQGLLNTMSTKCKTDYTYRLNSQFCQSRLIFLSDVEIASSSIPVPFMPNITNYCDIDVCLNYEHALRLPENNVNDLPIGKVPILSSNDNISFYLVDHTGRGICSPKRFPVISIQYAMPNVEHFARSELFSHQEMSSVLYIPSLTFYWDKTTSIEFRKRRFDSLPVSVISTFYIPERPRRKAFIDFLNAVGITNYQNVNGISDNDGTMKVYDKHHVLLNIRQNENLHTIEELRILPALSRRMIVISEVGPLIETLPYYSHILWVKNWNEFPDMIRSVTVNYSMYYDKLFYNNSTFDNLLLMMQANAYENTKKSLISVVNQKCKI